MDKIRIEGYRRKSFIKDVKKGPGVKMVRIPSTTVRSHLRKDTGAKGRTPKSQKWFKTKGTLSGWDKNQSEGERRSRASRGRSDLSSARALGALANVTTDRETRRIARADARYFYSRLKR